MSGRWSTLALFAPSFKFSKLSFQKQFPHQPEFRVNPEAEVFKLTSHPEAIWHRFLLQVEVLVVGVEGGGVKDADGG